MAARNGGGLRGGSAAGRGRDGGAGRGVSTARRGRDGGCGHGLLAAGRGRDAGLRGVSAAARGRDGDGVFLSCSAAGVGHHGGGSDAGRGTDGGGVHSGSGADGGFDGRTGMAGQYGGGSEAVAASSGAFPGGSSSMFPFPPPQSGSWWEADNDPISPAFRGPISVGSFQLKILQENEARGFPRMLSSIDCMHWARKNCPKGWAGMFTRGDKGVPTMILEAVASHGLGIWHAFFGTDGSQNDIKVLNKSSLFIQAIKGEAPQVQYVVNGTQ